MALPSSDLDRSAVTAAVLQLFPQNTPGPAVQFSQTLAKVSNHSLWTIEALTPDRAKTALLDTVSLCASAIVEVQKFRLAMTLRPGLSMERADDAEASLTDIEGWAVTLRNNCRSFLSGGLPFTPESLLVHANRLDGALSNLQQAVLIFSMLLQQIAGGECATA